MTFVQESVEFTGRLWIDTDAACGHSARTDPDDCLAIALLARATSDRAMPIRRLLEHNDAFSPEDVQVLVGAFDDTLRALNSPIAKDPSE